jgi:MoaA/NifB/PqqE/SkfB family radical SAM enzyme
MRVKSPLRAATNLLVHRSPIEAQLIVTRRCNLSCGYCTEYDDHSPEVPFEVLRERIDALHRLRAINIALLGGEPLLHSRLADIVAYANRHAQVSITTNGFLLSDDLIDQLNEAGLANLQVSIDAVRPDPTRYVQKTLKPLKPKLDRLARRARFDVHCTVVLTPGAHDEVRELLAELRRYPFYVSLNILHDDTGAAAVAGPEMEAVWNEHFAGGRTFTFLEEDYGRRLLRGERPEWQCRAGSRFLYVDEHGDTQFCSAQRGRLGKPIVDYTADDLRTHARTHKGCEAGCAILCTYRDSLLDNHPWQTVKSMVRSLRSGVISKNDVELPPEEGRRYLPVVPG